MIPVAFHSGIALLCSALIFPETARTQYLRRLSKLMKLLNEGIKARPRSVELEPSTSTSSSSDFQELLGSAEAMLGSLKESANLMANEIIFSRFDSKDFARMNELVEQLLVCPLIIFRMLYEFELTGPCKRDESLFWKHGRPCHSYAGDTLFRHSILFIRYKWYADECPFTNSRQRTCGLSYVQDCSIEQFQRRISHQTKREAHCTRQ